MKLALGLSSALAMLIPNSAVADPVFTLRARIEPQCKVVDVIAVPGSTEVVVRTACNVGHFLLAVGETESPIVETATGQNAVAVVGLDGTIAVAVDSPGIQTIALTLSDPLGDQVPIVVLQA